MAKNFATLYATGRDSSSLSHKFFIKEESAPGTLAIPTGADFIYHQGGSANSTQPLESSPYKTGRHNTSVIKGKFENEWSLSKFWDIDTTLGSAGLAEIDPAMRTLMKQAYGTEDTTGSLLKYTVGDPDFNFSVFEIGDMWAKQTPGAFVETHNQEFPGDGRATTEFAGGSKKALLIGIGQSNANNNANTVTLESGEGKRFKVGGLVQIIETDGTTRSDDTPDGSPRRITSIAGDVVTVDGAVLADADGSSNPVYLTYYEPDNPVAINNPQVGLQGSITISGLSTDCVRSASVNLTNNHEPKDFCFGTDDLVGGSGPTFNAVGRADIEVTIELNLNHELIEYINGLDDLAGDNIVLFLGDTSSRHLKITIPKVIFPIPAIEVPETGTIPVSFTAMANQTGLELADEITYELL